MTLTARTRKLLAILFLSVSFPSTPHLDAQGVDPAVQRSLDELRNVQATQHEEVATLQLRQQVVIDAMEKSYSNGFWFISIAVAITTLLSAIRYVQDQRLMKDAQDIGKSYKVNIETTNQLMISIKGALDYYKSAQEIEAKVNELKNLQTENLRHSQGQMDSLNDLAIELSPKCKRKAHNDPSIQRQVRNFHDQHEIVKRSSREPGRLNANGHFILGFHHRVENDYAQALDEFREAQTVALHDKNQSSPMGYGKLPSGVSLSEWLTKLANICAYHRAIIHNNLGEYDKAKECFEAALSYDQFDYLALGYIPETIFLGGLASFMRVVEEFEAAISRVNALTDDEARRYKLDKGGLLSTLYLKLGNCYVAETKNDDYKTHNDPVRAEQCFRKALEHDPASLFARLALAQLLQRSDRGKEERRTLFADVFRDAKVIVSSVTEAKILVMYYYIMLICCSLGEISEEAPGSYVTRIFEMIPRLPKLTSLRIFSPRSKSDLTVLEFTNEVQGFFKSQSSATTAPAGNDLLAAPISRPTARSKVATVGKSLLDD